MSATVRFIIRIYGTLVRLYPWEFHAEFAAEMQEVFAEAVETAGKRGWLSLATVCLQELRDWPGAALREHLHERRNKHMNSPTNGPVIWEPVSRPALLVGLALFLIPVIYRLEPLLPPAIIRVAFIALMAFIFGVSITGLFKGLPRWSLPSIGLLFSAFFWFIILDAFQPWMLILYYRIVRVGDEFSRYVWQGIRSGIFWVGLLLVMILIILILAAWRRTRPVYLRIRHDWTLVSFTLYGASLLRLFSHFDEYRYENLYMTVSLLSLAAGAWGYLRSASSRKRLLALLAGVLVAMLSMAVGKWIIVPWQDWPVWSGWHSVETERWFESLRTLVEAGWMLVVISVPALLNLLPRPAQPVSSG